MKKLLWMLSVAMIAIVVMTACKDDDKKTLADYARGTYPVTIEVDAFEGKVMPGTVVIAKTGAETVSLALKGFEFMPGVLIPISIEKATLTGEMNNISITSGTYEVGINLGNDEAGKPIIAKVDVKIDSGSTIKNKTDLDVNISVSKVPVYENLKVSVKSTTK